MADKPFTKLPATQPPADVPEEYKELYRQSPALEALLSQSEMVERIAKAIEAALPISFFKAQAPGHLACDFPLNAHWFREAARAAIAAMREPTEVMQEAGERAMGAEVAHDCEVRAADIYRAMINAALGG